MSVALSTAAYSLECDEISFVSSLSSCDFEDLELDDLSLVREYSPAGGKRESCQTELAVMAGAFNANHQSCRHLQSLAAFTLASGESSASLELFAFNLSGEFSCHTIQSTDEVPIPSLDKTSIPTSVVDGESWSYDYEEEKYDEGSEDHESHIEDVHKRSLDLLQTASNRSLVEQTESADSESSQLVKDGPPTGNSQLVKDEPATRCTPAGGNNLTGIKSNACRTPKERIQSARERRFEALKRYQDALDSTRTLNTAHGSSYTAQSFNYHEETVDEQETEKIVPSSSFQKTQKNSINDLRSRQRSSLKDLISAFEKVRHNTIAATTTTTKQ